MCLSDKYNKLNRGVLMQNKSINPKVRIGHVHLKTADISKVFDFYVGILGFEVVMRTESVLFVSAGGYHHHLAFNTWESEGGGLPERGTTGLYHVAILYPDKESFVDAIARLKKAGWPIDGVNDHGTHQAVYLRDPDSNGLELYWDRPKKMWPLDEKGNLSFVNDSDGARKLSELIRGV